MKSHPIFTYFIVILFFVLLNSFFYKNFWSQLWNDSSINEARFGEVLATEWAMEQVYQNTDQGKNPFTSNYQMLYPFGVNFSSTDSGNGILFGPFRKTLSLHQTASLFVILSILLTNLGMFALLQILGVEFFLSLVISLAFGYTTFLQNRMGHFTYFSIYVFPWFFASFFKLLKVSKTTHKVILSMICALILALALFTNLYYFVMLGFSIVLLLLYLLVRERQLFFHHLKKLWPFAILFFITFMAAILPWAKSLINSYRFDGLPKTQGWGGAIQYSSDIFGYFIPSPYSRFLSGFSEQIGSRFSFAYGIFENFSYPGIIILFGFSYILYLFLSKKISVKEKKKYNPLIFVSVVFFVLTLGPFLHVLGRWYVSVENIKIVFPMPFVFFHYLPFMANIRSPGRLIIASIFFSYVVLGLIFQKLLSHSSSKKKVIFLAALFLIFILDHSFIYSPPKPIFVAHKTYQTIQNDDSEFFTVYQMPSVIRDGFKYLGDLSSLDFIAGQLRHQKPFLGGYFGRISEYKMEYYRDNPFLGYMGRLMDEDVTLNGFIDQASLTDWQKIDSSFAQEAVDFLDLKYVVLDTEKPYAASASAVLSQLGFEPLQNEEHIQLLKRELTDNEYLDTKLNTANDRIYLGLGWWGRDDGFRWARKTSSVMFKVQQPRDLLLEINGDTYFQNQTALLYINQSKIGEISLTTENNTYTTLIPQKYFQQGINMLHIIFTQEFVPSELFSDNPDILPRSARFYTIMLKET